MKKILIIFLMIPFLSFGQADKKDYKKEIKKIFKFATFYGAVNGGNSVSDVDVFSVTGWTSNTIQLQLHLIIL